MTNDWITWGLQGAIGFILWQVWTKLDKTAGDVQSLNTLLLGQYMRKEEFETYRRETRETIHDLRGLMAAMAMKTAADAATVAKAALEAATGREKRKGD